MLDDLDIVQCANGAHRHQELEGVRLEYLRDAGAHNLLNGVLVDVDVQSSLQLEDVNRQKGLEGTDYLSNLRFLKDLSEHLVKLRPQVELDANLETLKQLLNDGLSFRVKNFHQGSLDLEVKLDALLAVSSSKHLIDCFEHRVRLFQLLCFRVIFVNEQVEKEHILITVSIEVHF